MCAVKVKKKKKKFGAGRFSSSAGSRELGPLRPKNVEKKPPCQDTCPSGNHVREFLTTIAQAEKYGKTEEQAFEEAFYIYAETSPFPMVCGRVCPAPCESECNRRELEGAVNINKVDRALGDFAMENRLKLKVLTDEKHPQTVGVVGGGPSGLSCAYQLARRGFGVTLYEAADKPGGMLRWGIPGYRLPEEILDYEINSILDLGVELKCGVKVGKDISVYDLQKQHDAVYVALGAQQGMKLGVEGEDAKNVFSGVNFLDRFHHGEELALGKDVVVIIVGGGDTAIDSARICRRLGANVTILYRRTRQEMPAIDEEVDEAMAEGVVIEFLAAPIGFVQEGDMVTAMKAIRMELGEPDDSGRRRPVPIEGSEFEIPASAVISAISQEPDFSGFEMLIEGRDWIKVDNRGATNEAGIWAGGDVTNLGLVTDAIGHGRLAAESIACSFLGVEPEVDKREIVRTDRMRLDHYEKIERATAPTIDPNQRLDDMDLEVNLPFPREQLIQETHRCMSCGYCFDCEKCWMFCQDQAVLKPAVKGDPYEFHLGNCTGCKKCAEECPCGFLDMV